MLKPTFAGDTIRVECEVTVSRPTSRPGRGFVETRNTVLNQAGETVLIYTPKRLVKGLQPSVVGREHYPTRLVQFW